MPGVERDALLIDVALTGDADLRPYVLLAPHLGGTGRDNYAEVADHGGRRVLGAQQGPFALALAAVTDGQRDAFGRASAGYVGCERRLAGLRAQRRDDLGVRLRRSRQRGAARRAAARLAAGARLRQQPRVGRDAGAHRRCSSPSSTLRDRHIAGWQRVVREIAAAGRNTCGLPPNLRRQFHISAMVLRTHQDKTYPGAMVASLSIPWGNTKEEREGYHLVWPRDLVECAGALLAVGATREAGNTLRYLRATQLADGHWYQNQWLGGKPYWTGVQLDETALPVLLAALLAERDALEGTEVADMVLRALSYIVRHGPASDQDRWEESAGLNTFTLAACIAALVGGAQYLPRRRARVSRSDFADYWNSRLEDWTAVRDTPLAQQFGIPGYYVRVAPPQAIGDRGAFDRVLSIKNQASDPGLPAAAQFGVDFLQLVRFGLRRSDDPLIVGQRAARRCACSRSTHPTAPAGAATTTTATASTMMAAPTTASAAGGPWPLLTGERGALRARLRQ